MIIPANRPNRPTIGLVSTLLWSWSLGIAMIDGAADCARRHDANFICFQGQRLDRQAEALPENLVYDMLSPRVVDGLVIWGSNFVGQIGHAATLAFFERFRPLPIVSIGMSFPEIPGFILESYQGMCNLLTHLITVHHYRKIAFCRGPVNHYDSAERYRAYLDLHALHQLPVTPAFISPPGEWHQKRIITDIDYFLQGNVHPEVIIAPNDELAIEAILELRRRGIEAPGDLAVIGLNDAASGRVMSPPLTTENIKLYERSYRAVEVLLQMIAGQTVPAEIAMAPQMVIRRSCGCISPALQWANVNEGNYSPLLNAADSEVTGPENIQSHRSTIIAELEALFNADQPLIGQHIGQLLDALTIALEDATGQTYLATLERVLIETHHHQLEVHQWHCIISALRSRVNPILSPADRSKADPLWIKSTETIATVEERLHLLQQIETADRVRNIQSFSQQLNSTFEWPPLLEIITTYLFSEGFDTFYLSFYTDPTHNLQHARLLLGYHQRQPLTLPEATRDFVLPDLVPANLLATEDCHSLFLLPLQYEKDPVGFILLERQPYFMNGIVYATLQNQLGSALWRTLLFQKLRANETMLLQHAQNLARSNTDLQQFVYVASHDLQEPLSKITVFTECLKNSAPPFTDKQQDYLERMLKATTRMQNLICDLLSFSQITSRTRPFEPVSLSRIAAAVIRDLESQITRTQAQITTEELPDLVADPSQMQQLFFNLLSNALKFHRSRIAPRIHIAVTTASREITLFFNDNGIGIHPDYHERIFTLFERLNDRDAYEGSGVGLPICRKIVERHGGSLTLESVPGSGSTFIVKLPLPR